MGTVGLEWAFVVNVSKLEPALGGDRVTAASCVVLVYLFALVLMPCCWFRCGQYWWAKSRKVWGDHRSSAQNPLISWNCLSCLLPSSHTSLLGIPQTLQSDSAPLHCLFPLPEMLFPWNTSQLTPTTSFGSLLKYHRIRETFMEKIATPSASLSSFLACLIFQVLLTLSI